MMARVNSKGLQAKQHGKAGKRALSARSTKAKVEKNGKAVAAESSITERQQEEQSFSNDELNHLEHMEDLEMPEDGSEEEWEDMGEQDGTNGREGLPTDGDDWEDGDDLEGEEQDDGDEGRPAKRFRTADEEEENRKGRAEQRALTQERKLSKPNAPLIQQAKKIWEKLRPKNLSPDDRKEQMEKLMDLVRGKVKDIIFKHDASRIIQCALKYGSQQQRDEIASELKGHYAELSKSYYGRFIVSKILNYCSAKYRTEVIQDFYHKVRRLVRHRDASIVLEEAYSQFANSQQRIALMEEFYGPEFALFKNAGGRTIDALIAANPHKKDTILRHLRKVLSSVLEKGFTNIGHLSIVHRALLEYMTYAEEKQIPDMLELLKEHLVTILHTREGARVAQLCIAHAGPKDRKLIIKSLKGFIVKIAKEQYGHAMLLSIFDCVDDTKFLEKAVIGELITDGVGPGETFGDLIRDKYGSRVILYLLCGRDRKQQPAFIIKELEEMDAVRARTSKKDDATRRSELLKAISDPLIETVTARCAELIRDANGSAILIETVLHAEGEKGALIEAIAQLAGGEQDLQAFDTTVVEPFNAVKKLKADAEREKQEKEGIDMAEHVLVNRTATLALKSMIAPRRKGVAEDGVGPAGSHEFAEALAKEMAPNVGHWLRHCAEDPRHTSGTAYVLVGLLEAGGENAQKCITDAVNAEEGLIEDVQTKMEQKLAGASITEIGSEIKQVKRKRKGGKGCESKPKEDVERSTRLTGIQMFVSKFKELSR